MFGVSAMIIVYIGYIPLVWIVSKVVWPIHRLIQFSEHECKSDAELLKFWKEAQVVQCGEHMTIRPTIHYIDISYRKMETCLAWSSYLHYDEEYFYDWIKLHRPEVHKKILKLQSMK